MLISTGVFMSFFRGSVRWACITDDHDFVRRGRIRVIVKKEINFLKGSKNGLPL